MIYFVGELDDRGKPTGIVKVGYTAAKTATLRARDLQCGNARPLAVLKEIKGKEADERRLHTVLSDWRLSGEWFAFSSQAVRVLTWKRVLCPPTFLAAIGMRYADAWERGRSGAGRLDFDLNAIVIPDDAEALRERAGSDGDDIPAQLRRVVNPRPDDGGAGAGAGLRVPSAWQRRVDAASAILLETAA